MEKSSSKHIVSHIVFDRLEVSFDLAHFVGILSYKRAVFKLEFIELIQ